LTKYGTVKPRTFFNLSHVLISLGKSSSRHVLISLGKSSSRHVLISLGKSSSRHVLISDVRECCGVTVLLVQIKRRNLELGEIQ